MAMIPKHGDGTSQVTVHYQSFAHVSKSSLFQPFCVSCASSFPPDSYRYPASTSSQQQHQLPILFEQLRTPTSTSTTTATRPAPLKRCSSLTRLPSATSSDGNGEEETSKRRLSGPDPSDMERAIHLQQHAQVIHQFSKSLVPANSLKTFRLTSEAIAPWHTHLQAVVKVRHRVATIIDHVIPYLIEQGSGDNILFDAIRKMPKVDLHIHLSGFFSLPIYRKWILEKRLWANIKSTNFDEKCSEEYSVSHEKFKNSDIALEHLAEAVRCVVASNKDNFNVARKFYHECFETRDSILDRVPLEERIGTCMREAKRQGIRYIEILHQGAIAMPLAFEGNSQVEAFERELSTESLQRIPLDERQKYIDEVCTRLLKFLMPYIEQSPAMAECLAQYRLCEKECGKYLIEGWHPGQPVKQAVEPITSGKSEITVCLIRELERSDHKDPSNLAFFWHALCSHYLIQKCRPFVRAPTPVGDESEMDAIHNFEAQMRILNYLKKNFKYPHLTIHTAEFAKDSNDPAADGRIRQTVKWGKPDRISHCLTPGRLEDLKVMDYVGKKGIGIECALSSNRLLSGFENGEHPFGAFLKRGNLDLALVTDDAGIFNTTLTHELMTAIKHYKTGYFDLLHLNRTALNMSYLADIFDPMHPDDQPDETIKKSIYVKISGRLEIQARFLALHDPNWLPEEDLTVGAEIRKSPRLQKMIQFERDYIKYEKELLEYWKKEYREWKVPQNYQRLRAEYPFFSQPLFDMLFKKAEGKPLAFAELSRAFAVNGITQNVMEACRHIEEKYQGKRKKTNPTNQYFLK